MEQTDSCQRGGQRWKEGEGMSQRPCMSDSRTWTTVWGLTMGARGGLSGGGLGGNLGQI